MFLQIVLQARLLDAAKLFLDPIDVFLGVFRNVFENFAGHEILGCFTNGDRRFQAALVGDFRSHIAFKDLGHVLADRQLTQILKVGMAVGH